MTERAIADYDGALRSILTRRYSHARRTLAKKGDLPKRSRILRRPSNCTGSYCSEGPTIRALAQEVERQGILKAIAGKPSFDCAAARSKVQRAICADPELANLDREVHGSYVKAIAEKMTPPQARQATARAGGLHLAP